MAATPTAMLRQQPGQSVLLAFPEVGGPVQHLDLIQIIDEGGNILLNVSYDGVVHNPATSNQGAVADNCRIGQFYTRLTSGTTKALFADAFSNPSLLDILQVINIGGNVSYWLDALGVAHGS